MSQNCCWHYLVQLTGNLWTLQMACFWVSGNPQNNVACVRPPLSLDFYCEKTNSNCWHCLVQLTGNLWTLQMAILVPVILWGIAQIFCGLYILTLASPGPGLIVPAGWSLVFSGACSVYFGSSQGDRQKMVIVVASFLSFVIGTGQLVLIRSHMMSKSSKPFEEMNELITETHLTEVIGFGSSFNAVFLFVALPYLLYE